MEDSNSPANPLSPPSSGNTSPQNITQKITPTSPRSPIPIFIWVIIGLVISLLFLGTGYLVWQKQNVQTDTTIYVATSTQPTTTPTATNDTMPLITPQIQLQANPYHHELANFEISIPLGWQIDDSGNSGAIVVFIDPETTLASGSAILTFINVSTGMASGETLNGYVISGRDTLQKTYPSYNLIEDKDLFINGHNCHLFTGTYQTHGLTIKNRDLLFVYNNRGYSVSATAPESVWTKKEMLINAVLFSFNLL